MGNFFRSVARAVAVILAVRFVLGRNSSAQLRGLIFVAAFALLWAYLK